MSIKNYLKIGEDFCKTLLALIDPIELGNK